MAGVCSTSHRMDCQRVLNPSVDVVDITCTFSALGLQQSLLDHDVTIGHLARAPGIMRQSRDDVGIPSRNAPTPRACIPGPNSWEPSSPTVSIANQLVVAKIENHVTAIAAEFLLQEEISIVIRTKKPAPRSAQAEFEYDAVESLVQFPGRTAQETWRFSKSVKVSQTSYC